MATIQGQWREHFWGISENGVQGVQNISRTISLKQKQQNDISGGGSGNLIGLEPVSASFSWPVNAGAGVNIKTEIENWERDIGQSDFLIIGGKYYYEKMLQLVTFSASEIKMDLQGNFISAVFMAVFNEYTEEKTEKKTSKIISRKPKKLTDAERTAIRERQGRSGAGIGPSQAQKNAEKNI